MIDLNPEIVQQIIELAREFQVLEDIEEPDGEESEPDDWRAEALARYAGDPAFEALKAAIDDLPRDQQVMLVALMWIGRGDFGPDEWDAAVERAEQSWTPRTAEYLIGTPLLAEYLAGGLEQIGTAEE